MRTDLCRENGVDGYPQMNLYRDGQFVETFKKAREFELLTGFISDHVHPEPEPIPAPPPPPVVPDPSATTKQLIAEAFKLPEEKIYNPSGNVVSLTDKTFSDGISDGHVFVKFFAPWYCAFTCPFPECLTNKV